MSDVPITRFQFLRGDIRGLRSIIRPPWALPEVKFLSLCNRCGECMRHCGQGVVEQNRLGYPRMNFSGGECTLCGECTRVCSTGALVRSVLPPWNIKPRIDAACLAHQGTMCRVCAERCEPEAIHFRFAESRMFRPFIVHDRCHGCGACVGVCPAQAITMMAPWNRDTKDGEEGL